MIEERNSIQNKGFIKRTKNCIELIVKEYTYKYAGKTINISEKTVNNYCK
jgi:DNA-binding CsgD family transcriptional regulator